MFAPKHNTNSGLKKVKTAFNQEGNYPTKLVEQENCKFQVLASGVLKVSYQYTRSGMQRLKVLQGRKKVKRFNLDATTVLESSRM